MIDLATRMVIGWQLAEHLRTSLVIDVLAMAMTHGHVRPEAIFHSDSEDGEAVLGFLTRTAMDTPGGWCQVAPGLPDPHFRLTSVVFSSDMSVAWEHLVRRLASLTV